MNSSYKNKLIKDFSNVSQTYGEFSLPQQENYLHLWHFLEQHYAQFLQQKIDLALDVGSGSGFGLQKLLQEKSSSLKKTSWIVSDISHSMLLNNGAAKRKVTSDMMNLPFKNNTFSLLICNFALHWSENISATLANMLLKIRSGGCILVSLPVAGSFSIIEETWKNQKLNSPLHQMPKTQSVLDILSNLECKSYKTNIRTLSVNVNSAKDTFLWLKKTGVKPKSVQQNRMNKSTYFRIVDELSSRFESGEQLEFIMLDIAIIKF